MSVKGEGVGQIEMLFEERKEPIFARGSFSYLRPKSTDADFPEWVKYCAMYFQAAVRNGRAENEALFLECAKHADDLHCSLFAMREGERMVESVSEDEFQKLCGEMNHG